MQAITSIHDVMPQTLANVERIFNICQDSGVSNITLLVVPGVAWDANALGALRELIAQGGIVAGHGWIHHVDVRQLKTPSGRLHAALISRNVAEHLALDENAIHDLISRCHGWFSQQALPAPELYVPPAWAMGAVSKPALRTLPFRYFEYFSGIYDTHSDTFSYAPLTGYEADTAFRSVVLKGWNQINLLAATKCNKPLRISIHPYDLDYRLADDLCALLARPLEYRDYSCIKAGGALSV